MSSEHDCLIYLSKRCPWVFLNCKKKMPAPVIQRRAIIDDLINILSVVGDVKQWATVNDMVPTDVTANQ